MLSETLSHRGVVGCYGGHLHQIKMSLVTCGGDTDCITEGSWRFLTRGMIAVELIWR